MVDIDSTADAELQHAIDTYGDSPVIVRTASGKAHLYYRHAGERRRIRPDKGHNIDILGEGGLAVAPPSQRPAGGSYWFERGGLGEFRRLPTIKSGAMAQLKQPAAQGVPQERKSVSGTGEVVAQIGQRNNTMFRLACALAQTAEGRAALRAQVQAANAEQSSPLPDDELQRAVGSAWRYRQEGRLMLPGCPSTILMPDATAELLLAAGETDVLALLIMALRAHGWQPGKVFALSPAAMERERVIGPWDKRRYRNAIRRSIELGLMVETYRGGRGPKDPSQYRLQKGGNLLPNHNQTPPSLSPGRILGAVPRRDEISRRKLSTGSAANNAGQSACGTNTIASALPSKPYTSTSTDWRLSDEQALTRRGVQQRCPASGRLPATLPLDARGPTGTPCGR